MGVIAGLLEGFVSPADFPWPLKLAIGLTTAVLLYSYLLLAGRDRAHCQLRVGRLAKFLQAGIEDLANRLPRAAV